MNIEFPESGQHAASFLLRKTGKYVLLNVSTVGERTSVAIFIKNRLSAAWRPKEKNKGFKLTLTEPEFSLTDKTISLSYDDMNKLGNNFHTVFEIMPDEAVNSSGRVAIGMVKKDGEIMGRLLTDLEAKSEKIRHIRKSLQCDLNTPILTLRKENHGKSIVLMHGSEISGYGNQLLKAFLASHPVYESLSELRGFGTKNVNRMKERPSGGGANLRYYMQNHPTNPLQSKYQLDYVDYELKPLNISDSLKWNCSNDPRTHSIDLLLSFQNMAVLTEVKMAGDDFLSHALVQLLYYASIMVNKRQERRLQREFTPTLAFPPWLCLIAQKRNEAGFANDMGSTLEFLYHKEVKRTLGAFFQGIFVLLIDEKPILSNEEASIQSFRIVPNEEHRIDWN